MTAHRRRRSIRALILVVGLGVGLGAAACKAEPKEKHCAESEELRRWMATLAKEGERAIPTQPDLEPVTVSKDRATTRLAMGPMIVVTRDHLSFNGVLIAGVAELAKSEAPALPIAKLSEPLATALRDLRNANIEPANAGDVVVQVDSTVSWGVVQRVGATAERAGFSNVVFVFRKPSLVLAPTPVGSRISLAEAFGSCAGLGAGLKQAVRDDRVSAFVRDDVAKLAGQCDCEPTIENIKRFMWWDSGLGEHGGDFDTGVRIRVAGDKPGREGAPKVLSAPANSPWAQSHRVVLEASKRDEVVTFLTAEPDSPR